jgi:hypothetical protein
MDERSMDDMDLDKVLGMQEPFPFKKALQVDFENRGKLDTQPLAAHVLENLEEVSSEGIKFLRAFLRPFDQCELLSVEIFESRNENGDFMLCYGLEDKEDSREFDNKYFRVFFVCDESSSKPLGPMRAIKLTAGYH